MSRFNKLFVGGASISVGSLLIMQMINLDSWYYRAANSVIYKIDGVSKNTELSETVKLVSDDPDFKKVTNSSVKINCFNFNDERDSFLVSGYFISSKLNKWVRMGQATISLSKMGCVGLISEDPVAKLQALFLYNHEVGHTKGKYNEHDASCYSLNYLDETARYFNIDVTKYSSKISKFKLILNDLSLEEAERCSNGKIKFL